MDKVITALSLAGVAAPWIVGLIVLWLMLHYNVIKVISDCFLDHRRFALDRQATLEAIDLAWANREQAELALSPPSPPPTPSLPSS